MAKVIQFNESGEFKERKLRRGARHAAEFCRTVFAAMAYARKHDTSRDELIIELVIIMARHDMWKRDNMEYIGTMLSIAGFDKREVRKALMANHLEQDWWFKTYGFFDDEEPET